MNQRKEPHSSLEHFPTPPWGTRALCELLEKAFNLSAMTVWEPACAEGHMARPLAEYFGEVYASDVHDYGFGSVDDFLFPGPPRFNPDWIITNPPFRLAEQFVRRALPIASVGVAMLVRTNFCEGEGRYKRLFRTHPPQVEYVFTERLPMFKGRLVRDGSTATAYSWLVWHNERTSISFLTQKRWIPPCRKRLEKDSDYD